MTRCPQSPSGFCPSSAPCLIPCGSSTFNASNTDGRESVEDVARAAICSLGSYDRGLQDYYQQRLNKALGGAR